MERVVSAKQLMDRLGSLRYVLIIAAVGVLLMLLPARNGGGASAEAEESEEIRIAGLLERIEGVGHAQVLLSEHGAVIVADGADSAAVRLRVTQAVRCYTGLGADEVQIFKTESSWRDEQ